jgi:hypothetical protein
MIYRLPFFTAAYSWMEQYWQRLFRLSLPFVILLASAVLIPRYALGNQRLGILFLLFVSAPVVVVLLKWPALGFVALIPASLYLPISISTGTGTSLSAPVLLLMLLAGLWVMTMVVKERKITIEKSRPVIAVIVFVLIAILAFAMGLLPLYLFAQQASLAAQIGGLSVFIFSALVFLLMVHQLKDIRWLQAITWTFLILGGIYIAGRLMPVLGTQRLFQHGAHGSLFWTWLTALAFGQAVFNRDLKPYLRWALLGLAAGTLAVGWFQTRDWASGWVPGLAAIGVIVWLRSWKMGIILSLAAIAVKLIFDPSLATDLVSADQYSIDTRWVAYGIVLELARANPLLGLGMSNYYHYTPLIPILGWYVPFNSHSQYIDLIAQTGFLGIVCFFWFMFEVWRVGWRLRSQITGGFEQAYVHGALGGLVGMLVAGVLGDWVLPFVYNVGLIGLRASLLGWLFLGGLVALKFIYMREEQSSPQPR